MESNLQQNFNVGFTNMKSDVLVHLTQWQYWWWFWFSLLWAFYYLMILKMIRFRSLKFRPRIATTLRPHGKWGDLIVCIIPVSWCANIITNSNFILRMIEWQSESGLLTVRIRGKQWYWVYKFELKTFTDVFTVPKNVGHNKWQISTPNDLQVADDYLHILQLRSQNRWVKSYWEELSKEMNKSKDFHMVSPKDFIVRSLNSMFSGTVDLDSSNEIVDKDGTVWIYDRLSMCSELTRFLSWVGFQKDVSTNDSDFNFPLSDELLEEFFEILKDNPISKKNFFWLIEDYFARQNVGASWQNSTAKATIFEQFDLFDLSEKDDDFVTFDYSNIEALKNYLFFTTRFNLNRSAVNFNLILELSNFFKTNIVTKFEDEEDVESFSSLHRETKTEHDERIEILNNMNFYDFADEYFDIDLANESSLDVNDKLHLDWNLKNHSDLFIRFFNKKSNWDESDVSLTDSMKFFLSNDEVFKSRSDEVGELGKIFDPARGSRLNSTNMYYRHGMLGSELKTYTYSDFNEFDRNSRKSQGTTSPVRLIKYPISNKTNFDLSSDVVELFRFRFNENESSTEHRLTPNSAFLIIRQKRYKRRKVILPRTVFYKDEDGNITKRAKSSNYTFLSQNSIILENDFNATKRYKFFKKNKMRDELTNLVLSKRILRTRRTLVLPAHLNITAITNSFDVIHSWFIPGLGLKMDAIPGRATHHTFYIDNVGFYYGQCAEICGRYHHHMPIRICALPFEHFLLWWQSFGLPKLLFTKNFRRYSYSYGSRKYAW